VEGNEDDSQSDVNDHAEKDIDDDVYIFLAKVVSLKNRLWVAWCSHQPDILPNPSLSSCRLEILELPSTPMFLAKAHHSCPPLSPPTTTILLSGFHLFWP
jgi:hypothetical protein